MSPWTGRGFQRRGSVVRVRLRPVLMMSPAFFFGTMPLAVSSSAGAGAQNSIGTAVTGGLLSATFIDLFFIPFFFVQVSRLVGRKPVGEGATASIAAGEAR